MNCTCAGWYYDSGTHTRAFYAETSTSTGSLTGACGTVWGLLAGQHTCNSDSREEILSISTNSNQRANSICYTPVLYAPSCS